jgi:predicted aconitase with swiveling domain
MATKTFNGRPLLAGNLEGKALATNGPFNTTGSYLENMFAGNSTSAPCTDPNNKEMFGKELKDGILCFTTTVGSTLGGAALMGVNDLGVGPKAMLFSQHVDSVSLAGLLMDDIWNERRVIVVDLLGDEFLESVKNDDPITIKEDGTVIVG